VIWAPRSQCTKRCAGGPFRHTGELFIKASLLVCATVSLVTTVAIVAVLFRESFTFFQEVSLADFFASTRWQPLFEPVSYGIWELVAGTANVVLWSLVLALPVGLAGAGRLGWDFVRLGQPAGGLHHGADPDLQLDDPAAAGVPAERGGGDHPADGGGGRPQPHRRHHPRALPPRVAGIR
jgi:hypothetical protein